MTFPVHDPKFWTERYREVVSSNRPFHQTVFKCPEGEWNKIQEKHCKILKNTVREHMSVLDIGCGWGRVLGMMPMSWYASDKSSYVGYDLCPEFIEKAYEFVLKYESVLYDNIEFYCRDFMTCPMLDAVVEGSCEKFDLCVMISFRPMIIRNSGQSVWDLMHRRILEVSNQQLYLEYDVKCDGYLEPSTK